MYLTRKLSLFKNKPVGIYFHFNLLTKIECLEKKVSKFMQYTNEQMNAVYFTAYWLIISVRQWVWFSSGPSSTHKKITVLSVR